MSAVPAYGSRHILTRGMGIDALPFTLRWEACHPATCALWCWRSPPNRETGGARAVLHSATRARLQRSGHQRDRDTVEECSGIAGSNDVRRYFRIGRAPASTSTPPVASRSMGERCGSNSGSRATNDGSAACTGGTHRVPWYAEVSSVAVHCGTLPTRAGTPRPPKRHGSECPASASSVFSTPTISSGCAGWSCVLVKVTHRGLLGSTLTPPTGQRWRMSVSSVAGKPVGGTRPDTQLGSATTMWSTTVIGRRTVHGSKDLPHGSAHLQHSGR